jgi:multidrug transporter EmrE-like cation transporter
MPQTVTFVKGAVAGSVNLLIGFFTATQPMQFESVAPAIVVGIFSYGFSIMLYVTSAQNIGATRGQILFSTAPVWGVLLSYLLFQDSFQWVHIISILLLALAVVITNVLTHKHFHSHIAMEHIHYHHHTDSHHNHSHDDEAMLSPKWHSHFHTHDPVTHEHPHDPDLHHRHEHD